MNGKSTSGQYSIQWTRTLSVGETENMNPLVSVPTDLDKVRDTKPHTSYA